MRVFKKASLKAFPFVSGRNELRPYEDIFGLAGAVGSPP